MNGYRTEVRSCRSKVRPSKYLECGKRNEKGRVFMDSLDCPWHPRGKYQHLYVAFLLYASRVSEQTLIYTTSDCVTECGH